MSHSKQLGWAVPFLCLGLIALILLRPFPVFPSPSPSRILTDAQGTNVAIPVPLRGVAGLTGDFLQKTHAPEMVLEMGRSEDRAGYAHSLMGRIYPQLVENPALWRARGNTLEAVVADDNGNVYFSDEKLRQFGLHVVVCYPARFHGVDNYIFTMTRTMSDAIGQPQRAQNMIDVYQNSFANLNRELQVETLADQPRAIGLVYSSADWSHLWASEIGENARLGIRDGTAGFMNLGRQGDAERILAMNPDLIVLNVGSVHDFLRDPRWQGMKVVQTHRIYVNTDLRRYTFDVDNAPLGARWLAEIAHPERLQPRLRGLMREHYLSAYNYRLSDEEIDEMLHVDANRESADYSRFMKSHPPGAKQGSPE